jgi:hypothetical protein
MNDADFKICPFCQETIRVKAVKCRFCGEWLSDSQTTSATLPVDTSKAVNPEIPTPPALPSPTAQTEAQQATPAERSPIPSPTATAPAGNERSGLKWMNGILLALWAWGLGANIIGGDLHRKDGAYAFGMVLGGIVFLSASWFGLLAAKKPDQPSRRKRAKWSNLAVAVLASFMVLGYASSNIVYGFILGAIVGLPALINLRAFWGQQPTIQPHAQISPPSTVQLVAKTSGQADAPDACESKSETGQSTAESATPVQQKEGQEHAPKDAVAVEAPPEQASYFIRHWRGDLSLGVSYWANGMLGTFLVLFAANMLVEMRDTVSLQWLAVLSLVLYALALLVSAWQAVGVWRSAGKHTSRGGNSGWATAARIAVGFGVLSTIGVFINNYIPQSAEMLRILAGDKSIPAYKITVLPGGAEVEFRGGLRAGSAKELEKILAAVPQAKVLHIESIGGRILEAKAMSTLVRARQMTTYTSERCLSAATLVLMSGKERVIATDAKVGFHAGNFPGLTSEQMREMNDATRTTMQAAGVSASFISRVLSTPNGQMWYPTYEEMRAAGVITSQSAGERFASSWGLPGVNLEAAVESMSTYPCFRTIKQVEPDTFNRMMSNFVAALRSGKSEGEAVAAISEVAGNMMSKYMPAASDEAILAMRDQWIAILAKYKDKNSQACIAVFTQAKINYKRVFPDWNMTNSLIVMEKVISSGASEVPVPIEKEAAEKDHQLVWQPLSRKFGDDVQLLEKQSAWPDNSQKVCDMLLFLYQQVATLPDKRSANLVRYLTTSE